MKRFVMCADRGAGPVLGALVLVNLITWVWAYAAFADRLPVMATALLAWVFGLRHAVDADHIAAIDNVVRKLMQTGGAPKFAGLYFALGHSTVVVVAAFFLSVSAIGLLGQNSPARTVSSLIAVSVSATFLLVIALLNLVTFIGLCRTFRSAALVIRQPAGYDTAPATGGILVRLLGPMFGVVTKSWHMYPVGFVFGLGFDTATEIGIISIATAEAVRDISFWSILVFPALFAAGMALVDTADSVLMARAYHWAHIDPIRKLWYNLTITGTSVVVALFVGTVEGLGILGERLQLSGRLWVAVANLNDRLASFGFMVIALFAAMWLVSVATYHAVIAGHARPLENRDLDSLQ